MWWNEEMGIIPEENEEKWGTGKFEDLTATGRVDLEDMEGFQGPKYDDDLAWAEETKVEMWIYEENEWTFPPELNYGW